MIVVEGKEYKLNHEMLINGKKPDENYYQSIKKKSIYKIKYLKNSKYIIEMEEM